MNTQTKKALLETYHGNRKEDNSNILWFPLVFFWKLLSGNVYE